MLPASKDAGESCEACQPPSAHHTDTRRVLPDLDNPPAIAAMVEAFYARLLQDRRLAPIFLDVAAIDLQRHLPLIKSYWEKLLLGDRSYQRHTMDIHRAIDSRRKLQAEDFDRWLALFTATVEHNYAGPGARRAVQLAGRIAANMQRALDPEHSR